ncbi:ArsR/SmtB family transcription factor [Candidatus Enterococcus clewellii]|uniref:HTH arsR-type domain-containing protein n=1 Tax=Candidatus Enterococcus clewellii TaxID=1834193 RepID=A0A242JX21_9ENTE|nr:ArsR family transcriptional regulator [Enterococcus sp. 9E7_DIV0242]OTP09867.1 hypothetical protein A5888_004063 [Enterococcus sp. 9E7_DIV0242]
MELSLNEDSLQVYKALASDTRLHILNLISEKALTVSELARLTGFSKAIISRHMKILEDAQLVHLGSKENYSADNRKKTYVLSVDRIEIEFPNKIYLPYKKKVNEIKLGYYSDFSVQPTCGLADSKKIIGSLDDPRSFVSNERVNASLLWFADGFVEYVIPNDLDAHQCPELLEISLEISSEFPESNNNWPSDISFFINDIHAGTWTLPGNYSDVRGKYTPSWWESHLSQYGLLKHLRITNEDTGMDGKKISDVTLNDLKLNDSPFIKLRIGIEPSAVNKGGLTIFGDSFGNHPQNILSTLYYSEKNNHLS